MEHLFRVTTQIGCRRWSRWKCSKSSAKYFLTAHLIICYDINNANNNDQNDLKDNSNEII